MNSLKIRKKLTKLELKSATLFLLLFFSTGAMFAQPDIANSISFQGALNGADRQSLPNGNYNLTDPQNGFWLLQPHAFDLSPGLVVKAEGQPHADGEQPLAMSGRVWCWVDASAETGGGPVKRGDRLTTSATFGPAMKLANESEGPGAVIGKAMTELPDGKGLVLVLVNLQ